MIGLTIALLAEVIRNARISMSNARRRRRQRDLIRQEISEYEQQFPTEEHIYVHQRVGQTLEELHDMLGPQYEQDMEEPLSLTGRDLEEEMVRISQLADKMHVPHLFILQPCEGSSLVLAYNIKPAHTSTRIFAAWHDVS